MLMLSLWDFRLDGTGRGEGRESQCIYFHGRRMGGWWGKQRSRATAQGTRGLLLRPRRLDRLDLNDVDFPKFSFVVQGNLFWQRTELFLSKLLCLASFLLCVSETTKFFSPQPVPIHALASPNTVGAYSRLGFGRVHACLFLMKHFLSGMIHNVE